MIIHKSNQPYFKIQLKIYLENNKSISKVEEDEVTNY